jgi:hypothetical protein
MYLGNFRMDNDEINVTMLDLSYGAKLLISLRTNIMSLENLSQNFNEYYIE